MKFGVAAVVEKVLRTYTDLHLISIYEYDLSDGCHIRVVDFSKELSGTKLLHEIMTIKVEKRPKSRAWVYIKANSMAWNGDIVSYTRVAGTVEELSVESFLEEFGESKRIFDSVAESFAQVLPDPSEEVTSDV